MSYTVKITETYDEPNRENDGVTPVVRELYSQTVDVLDMQAVLRAVNPAPRRKRTKKEATKS